MRLSSSLPRAALPSVFLWLTLLACGAPDPEAERPEALADEPPAAPAAAPLVSARPDAGVSLPRPPGALGPSHVEVHGSVPLSPDALAEFMRTEDCAACHQEIAASWASSAHARSSFDNPFYRASIERFRAARGEEASRFCAGCHDPALLLSGVIDQPTIPADERASAGIPCRLCHGVTEARADGNGSYVWSAEPIPLPDPADPVQVAAHRARVGTDVLRSTVLCGSCHRSFAGHEIGSPHHFNGIDDLGAFGTSAFGGAHGDSLEADVEPSTCRGCHMQREPATHDMAADNGSVPSHRFAGAHLSLTTDPAQHAAVRARLQDVVRIDIPAGSVDGRRRLPLEGSPARSGSRVTLDVVIRNLGVGHRFPGGTRDLQDTFVELRIVDAAGALVAEAGTQHAESGDDPTAFGLRAVPLDAQALPEELHDVHDFVVAGFDRSLAARDATVVRYEVTLPELSRAAWPLRVEALLRHRRHLHGVLAHRLRGVAHRGRAGVPRPLARWRGPVHARAHHQPRAGRGVLRCGQHRASGGGRRHRAPRRALLRPRSRAVPRAARALGRRARQPGRGSTGLGCRRQPAKARGHPSAAGTGGRRSGPHRRSPA
ncbi:MAG: hypothetical protein IPH72_22395 [Sandaracinaceae bacterium]|nr:hypothetical protein [Sandaracinaceae bacterium]